MYPYNYQQSILPGGGYHCVSDILVLSVDLRIRRPYFNRNRKNQKKQKFKFVFFFKFGIGTIGLSVTVLSIVQATTE